MTEAGILVDTNVILDVHWGCDDVIIRYEDTNLIGITVLHASQRAAANL